MSSKPPAGSAVGPPRNGVATRHGTTGLVLLFADARIEEPSLYRSLEASARQLGVPLVRVADGRTPFEVVWDQHFLDNTRPTTASQCLQRGFPLGLPITAREHGCGRSRRCLTLDCCPAFEMKHQGGVEDEHEQGAVHAQCDAIMLILPVLIGARR